MMKMMSIMQSHLLTEHLLMNKTKFRICISKVKLFLQSILKLLLHIVFVPFIVLTSMSSDISAGGIVIVLGI